MKPEERIAETSRQCAAILNKPLVEAITHAITGGFLVGKDEGRNLIIDEVCNWIYQHSEAYLIRNQEGTWFDSNSLISDLKKAMKI